MQMQKCASKKALAPECRGQAMELPQHLLLLEKALPNIHVFTVNTAVLNSDFTYPKEFCKIRNSGIEKTHNYIIVNYGTQNGILSLKKQEIIKK